MNRIATTALAALAAMAVAVPVAAQDTGPQHVLLVHDNDIDGPVATAVAAAHQAHTDDTVDVVHYAADGIAAGPDVDVDCVVAVGRNAHELAGHFAWASTVTAVVGADRYATAEQVAAAVDGC